MPSHTGLMTPPTTSRWPAWAGWGFVVFAVGGYVVGPANLPDTGGKDGLSKLATYYSNTNNWDRQAVSAVLFVFSVFAFLWFLGGLRARLRSVEADVSPVSNLVMGAGVAFAVLFGAAGLFMNSIGAELKFDDAFQLTTRSDFNLALFAMGAGYALLVVAMIAMSVLLFATWAIARQTRVLPPWVAWTGFVFGLAGLGIWFTAWVMPLAVALWVLLTSIALFRSDWVKPADATAATVDP
jgi:hypothetical protein